MNAKTREELNKIYSEIEGHKARLEEIANEEQDKFDNLSEGLQAAERGQAMEQAASTLQDAVSSLDEALGMIEEVKDAG